MTPLVIAIETDRLDYVKLLLPLSDLGLFSAYVRPEEREERFLALSYVQVVPSVSLAHLPLSLSVDICLFTSLPAEATLR